MTLNEIKDKIYEAEGLLELLRLRQHKLEELRPLVLSRLDEAKRALIEFGCDETTHEDDTPIYAVDSTEIENHEPDSRPDKKAVKPAFCLNDRFRFRRSIFGGSDADFNAAMDNIATLDSYEEAEEIFYGDMELNPEDPDVVDFMNIIKDYFGQ